MIDPGLFFVFLFLYLFGFIVALIIGGGDYPRAFVWPIVFVKFLIKGLWSSIKYICKTIIE
jgi:hypothetical protein